MAGFLSLLKRIYLSIYNWTVFVGWFQVLYIALKTLNESGHEHVYAAVEKPLLLAQSAAFLEILHGLVGLVRSPITATLPQIGSRLYLTWGILYSFPEVRTNILVSSLVISWGITEVIRYSFFGSKEALGSAPSFLLWLRYSAFLLLYPTGIASEVGLIYTAMPYINLAVVVHHKVNPSFSLLTSSLSDFNGIRLSSSIQYKRKVWQPKGALHVTASSAKKILIMGGTRFIGVFLSRLLVKEGHQVTLFTRGKAPITQHLPGESDVEYNDFKSKIFHLKGDRKDFDFVRTSLAAEGFDVVYDINGREADEVEPILDALPNLDQYIYCSSAGVYLKSDILPHFESDAVDPKSRHKGKLNTESFLQSRDVNWTSLRPVYIYGPLNYNPIEEWFFHRLSAGRPIPIPGSGLQVTQLGHVQDLAKAFVKVLGNEKAIKQIFNISGEKYVTFDGLAKACAKAGGFPEPEIVHYNPKEFDFGKKKAFPFRDQHFFTSVEKAKSVLGLTPEFGLVEGLANSYQLDYERGVFRKEADFTTDDLVLGKKLVLQS